MKSKHLLPMAILLTACLLPACAVNETVAKEASYHHQMGLSMLAEQDATRALIEFSEAEKLTPDDPILLNNLGIAYYYKKKFALAEQRYLRALALKPDYTEARNNLGVTYLEMQRWDDAILQFKQAAADMFFLGQEDARINLGLAYLGKGDYEKALATLRPVVAENSRNPVARVSLGRVYFAMEKNALAIEEFKKSIGLNKNYVNAHFYLGLVSMKDRDFTTAAQSFREVLRIAPDSEKGQLSREYLDSMK